MIGPPPAPPAIVAPAPWIAAPRPWGRERWLARHALYAIRAAHGGIDVMMLGDSITEFFEMRAFPVWWNFIEPFGDVADFGISGDRTAWLLWRIENGEVAPSQARAVVVLIGTNDLEFSRPEDVARGIRADVEAIRARLPHATIVLNALLPRGAPGDPLRAKAAAVNALIRPLARAEGMRWLDAGPRFLDAAGRIPAALMADGLHPTPAGYELWASALRPVLADVLST